MSDLGQKEKAKLDLRYLSIVILIRLNISSENSDWLQQFSKSIFMLPPKELTKSKGHWPYGSGEETF